MLEKICPVCHKAFYNSHKKVKTCSKKCGSILRFKNKEKKLEQVFIKNLEQRHPDISYISGYGMQHRNNRRNTKILVQCKKTGIRYYVYDSHLRKKNGNVVYVILALNVLIFFQMMFKNMKC